MADLFDNDVDSVMTRYMREITGWSALSSKAGIKNRAQLDRFVSKLKSDARKSGDDVKDIERLIDIGLKSTFGRSTELDPASRGARYARFLRNWNFARVMNQVGFSLFAELGPTIAHAGLRNFWNSVGAARDFLVRGADGKLSSQEARVMERLFAPGTDWLRNPPFLRLDEDALVPQTFNVKHGEKIDNAMNMATHVTSVASGMARSTRCSNASPVAPRCCGCWTWRTPRSCRTPKWPACAPGASTRRPRPTCSATSKASGRSSRSTRTSCRSRRASAWRPSCSS